MAVSRAMRRLLHVLELEEEQAKVALELALSDLKRLHAAFAAAGERDRGGRRLVASSAGSNRLAGSNETVDRLAGLEEMRAACRHRAALTPRIAQTEQAVAVRREQFLAKRIDRRQAETLIAETEAADAVEAGRRGQRELDDWFLSRLHGARNDRGEARTEPAAVQLEENRLAQTELE